MKKVINVNIGGINFLLEEDAQLELQSYLSRLENSIAEIDDRKEIMEDIENRIAEILSKDIKYSNQTVDIEMVSNIKECIGEFETSNNNSHQNTNQEAKQGKIRKLYRNPDDKKIAGVCGGIATYFDIDSTIVRVAFIIAGLLYGSALLVYLILCIVMPVANTTIKKLMMKGEPITPENIKKYS